MIDLLKKGMLAGLGATVTTKDTVESILNDLVEKGKLSRDEAKQTADNIVDQSRKEFEDVKGELNKRFVDMLNKGNVATKDDIAALEARVLELEKALAAKTDA